MRWVGYVVRNEKREIRTKIWLESLKKRDHNVYLYHREILKSQSVSFISFSNQSEVYLIEVRYIYVALIF
jgi:hypothetical protein